MRNSQWSYELRTRIFLHRRAQRRELPDNPQGWYETSRSQLSGLHPADREHRFQFQWDSGQSRGDYRGRTDGWRGLLSKEPVGLTLLHVRIGVGSPWALHGIWTSDPDSTVKSLGAFVKTGLTDDVKTHVNDYSAQRNSCIYRVRRAHQQSRARVTRARVLKVR